MNLYLVRHADALPVGSEGVASDEERPLSREGLEQVERLAAALRRVNVSLDRVLTSPLVRARQTAEVLVQHLQLPNLSADVCEALAPGGSPKKLAKGIRQLEAEHVALVGHEPDLGQHTAWLIGSKRAGIEFAKAGVACVACHEARKAAGSLLWLVTPNWFGG